MNYTKQNNNNYYNVWGFIEEYLPNYYNRDDVLYDDILLRFFEDDDVSEEDMEWIQADFNCNKNLIKEELVKLELGFMAEAIQAYYESRMRMPNSTSKDKRCSGICG